MIRRNVYIALGYFVRTTETAAVRHLAAAHPYDANPVKKIVHMQPKQIKYYVFRHKVHLHRGGFRVYFPLMMKKSIVNLINRSSPRKYKGVAQLLIEDEDQEHNIIRIMLSRLNKVCLKQNTAPEDVEILRQHYDKIRRVLSDQTTLKNRLISVSCCKHVRKSDLMNMLSEC